MTNKNGPRQQIEARTAVIPPMDNAMRVLLKGDMYTKVHSLPRVTNTITCLYDIVQACTLPIANQVLLSKAKSKKRGW